MPLVLFSIPIGILRRPHATGCGCLLVLALCWTAGTFLTALAPNAWVLFVGRMLTGIGTTGALTAALSLTADLCRPEQRGRAMLIVTLGKSLGIGARLRRRRLAARPVRRGRRAALVRRHLGHGAARNVRSASAARC